MKDTNNPTEQSTGLFAENKKRIENHKKAAKHHAAAARHHLDAAKYHEEGNHGKAFRSTILAHGNHRMAVDCQKESIQHQTYNN